MSDLTDLDREIIESLKRQSEHYRSRENQPWVSLPVELGTCEGCGVEITSEDDHVRWGDDVLTCKKCSTPDRERLTWPQ